MAYGGKIEIKWEEKEKKMCERQEERGKQREKGAWGVS
jgi:hypothetical protein